MPGLYSAFIVFIMAMSMPYPTPTRVGIFGNVQKLPRFLHEVHVPRIVDVFRVHIGRVILRGDDDAGRNDGQIAGAGKADADRAIGCRVQDAIVASVRAVGRNNSVWVFR